MKQLKVLSALSLMAVAGAANAGISGTVTAASDYDFRGVTQTAQDPALQGSLDFAADFGLYVGAWASNVDFGDDTTYELDLYAGYSHTFGESGFGIDIGVVGYTYDESQYNFVEEYVGASYKWVKLKVFATSDFGGMDESALYVSGDITVPLPANFSILGHVGMSQGDGIAASYSSADDSYMDYSVGVGYTAGNFNFALKWIDGSDLEAKNATVDDVLSSDARAVLTVATTFPWK